VKKIILFFIITACYVKYNAQSIPNLDFETWEGGVPGGWFTSNLLNIYVPITQSLDAYSGQYSVKGTVIESPNGLGYTPLISAGYDAKGFPLTYRAGALHGWYKFNTDSGDAFFVTVSAIKDRKSIGSGGYFSSQNQSIYKEFEAGIKYKNDIDIPDTVQIIILITNSPKIHSGSTYILDDLSFGSATLVDENAINQPFDFLLEQNYPNPFNPSTIIQFQLPEKSFVSLKIFNLLGKEIATLINEQFNEGKYRIPFDASKVSGGLPAGLYFYRFQAGSFSEVKKMTYIK
jgi:hypothetical protein